MEVLGSTQVTPLLRRGLQGISEAGPVLRAMSDAVNATAPNVSEGGMLTNIFYKVETDVDRTLWLVGRIMAAIVLVLCLAVCALAPILKKQLSNPNAAIRPARPHKIKQCLYNLCLCGFCCPALPKSLGFNALQSKTLRLTLISASDLKRCIDFYFEVWTEPSEGHPKNTRLHQQASGTVSLHQEKVELDWFGDESEVVLDVVQYCGSLSSRDQSVGQVRIPRGKVEQYALEAASDPNNLHKGTRTFQLRTLSPMEAKQRKFRLNGYPPVLLPKVLNMIQEEQGFEVPDKELHDQLKWDNEVLRRENEQLGGTMHTMTRSALEKPKSEVLMSVAIRFEVVIPGEAHHDGFKSASFDEGPSSPWDFVRAGSRTALHPSASASGAGLH